MVEAAFWQFISGAVKEIRGQALCAHAQCGQEFVAKQPHQLYCCKRCQKAAENVRNRERIAEQKRAYAVAHYMRNRAEIREKQRVYWEAHRDQLLEKQREYARQPRRRAAGALSNAIRRCYDESSSGYENYGGRGITVDERYLDPIEGVQNLIADIGLPDDINNSLERLDYNRGYEPGNLSWIPLHQQAWNRRSTRLVTAFGESKAMAAWAYERGLHRHTLSHRIDRLGWSAEEAVTVPTGLPSRVATTKARQVLQALDQAITTRTATTSLMIPR